MCKAIFTALLIAGFIPFMLALPAGKMEVERTREDRIIIRSGFSPEEELFREASPGRNGQFNFTGSYLKNKKNGKITLIHRMGDDVPSFSINGTCIGANHGCSDAETLEIRNHKLTRKDLGKKVVFGKKVFYIVGISSPHTIGILSEPLKTRRLWAFCRLGVKRGEKISITLEGKKYEAFYKGIHQFRPSVRFLEKKFLADGRELKKGEKRLASTFIAREVYEVLKVDEALRSLINSPGRPLNTHDPAISTIVRNDFSYIFRGDGSCIVDSKTTPLRDLYFSQYLGIMSVALAKNGYDKHLYYIPKTLPFTAEVRNRKKEVVKRVHFDFGKGADFHIFPFPNVRIGKKQKNLADPNSYPDAYIQFLCRKKGEKLEKEVGYALGFHILEGDARQEKWEKTSSNPVWIYVSRKTYPLILERKSRKKGETIHIQGYRHYFHVPSAKVPGSLYSHIAGKYRYFYYDSHHDIPDFILKNVPEGKLEIVEKSKGLTLVWKKEGVKIKGEKPYARTVFRVVSEK